VHAESLSFNRVVVGRLARLRTAEVRARVPSIRLKRLYREGSEVMKGREPFLIDPAPFQAALDAALLAHAQERTVRRGGARA
jgi:membrane fusion protein (multidrug efflux system)